MLTYSLQVSLCWLVYYGLYYSLLSRETFFRLNRIYLIISLLCGLIAPFGQIFIEVENASPTVIMLETFVVTARAFQPHLAPDTEGVFSLRFFFQLVYGLGVGVMTLRFLIGLFKILRIYKKGKKVLQNGCTLIHTEGVHLPFSFFKWIFINENALEKQDISQIIEHEKAHVQQGHSYDVIFLELLKIIFWWNPIIYFYRHSLRNIHEYLADAAVLRWVERPIYGRLLIKQSQSGPALALANHFIFSQLKKRIIMMTRNRSQRASLLKYVIALPIFTLLLTLFAIPNNEIMAKTKDLSEKVDATVSTIDNKIQEETKPQTITNKNQPVIPSVKNGNERPFVTLGTGEVGGSISIENIKKQTKLVCIDALTQKPSSIKITSFALVYIPREDDPKQTNQYGSGEFNSDIFKLIGYAKDGDSYHFMNITGTDGIKTVNLGSMSFVIKILNEKQIDEDIKKTANTTDGGTVLLNEKPPHQSGGFVLTSQDTSKDKIFTIADENPEFPQGQMELFRWLGSNIKYPAISRENGIQGTVYIGFVVEKDGSITDITVKRGVKGIVRDTVTIMEVNGIKGNKYVEREDHSIDNEAKRVIAAMPKWKPGKIKGEIVRVAYILPIKFKLE